MKRLLPFVILLLCSQAFGATSSVSRSVYKNYPFESSVANDLGEFYPHLYVTGATVDSTYRIRAKITQNASNLRLWFANTEASGGAEVTADNAITIAASIQLDSGGTPTGTPIPATFANGATTYSLAASGVVATDPIGITVTAGQTIWVLTHVNITSASYGRNKVVNVVQFYSGEAVGAGNQTRAVTSMSSTSSGGNAYAPFMITGHTFGYPSKAIFAVGDSNMTSYRDMGLGTVGTPRNGWLGRAAGYDKSVIKTMLSGDTLASWVTQSGTIQRIPYAIYAKTAFVCLGTNDMGTLNTTQMQSHYSTIVGYLRKYGIEKFYACTILPRATSSDGWKTVGNQTTESTNTDRVTMNTWFSTQVGTLFDGVLDIASAVENSAGSGIWKADSNAVTTGSIGVGSTSSLLVLSGSLGTNNDYAGYTLRMTSGATSGSLATILYHSGTSLQLVSSLSGAPSSTDTFEILNTWTMDGVHASTRGVDAIADVLDMATIG